MSSITLPTLDSGRASRWRWLRNPAVLIGLALIIFWVGGTLIAPLILPYQPLQQNINDSLQAPGGAHFWGTDKLGRDIFTRVLYGTRISLPAGVIAVIGSLLIGTSIGALAGYIGGLWDELLMRITDVFLAFPTIILAMAVAAALGPSVINAIITIAVVSWPNYARVTRSVVLSVKHNEYVEAARAVGATHRYTLIRTVLPNCIGPLIVLATIDLGNAILIFAGLSFLGLGPAPETPEWGRMIADGIDYADQWWVSAFPGLAIFSVVMALNFIGDGLRDALDPRTNRK
jgi:ABC-type dipeptide/oligopeptide/nickel transport system permease subunit